MSALNTIRTMNTKIIRFFNYESAFDFYTKKIKDMKQGNIKRSGIKKIAKPVLILSIIRGIENGTFRYNRFLFEDLEDIYNSIFKQYAIIAKQSEKTNIAYPLYYLQTDELWHLNFHNHSETKTASPSTAWVRKNVEYAYIDEELWLLLHNPDYRLRMKNFIIETKIKNVKGNHSLLIKQFVGWLLAI